MPSTHYTASDGFTYTLDFEKEPTAGAIAEAQSGLESQLSERARQAQATASAGQERGRLATIGNTAARSFVSPLASMTRGLGEMTDSPSLLRGAEQLQAGTNAYFPVNPAYEQEIPTKIVGSAAGLASGALPFMVPVVGPTVLGPASLIPQTYDAGYQQAEAAGLPASDVRSMGATNAIVQTPMMTFGGRVTRGLLTGGVHDLSPLRGLAVGTAEAGAIGGASRVGENLVAGPSGYNIDPNRSILDEVPQSAGYMAGGSALLGGIPALLRSLPPRTPAASTAPPATPAPPPGALTPEGIAAASPFFSTGVNPAELAAKAKAANAASRSAAALTPEQIAIFNAIKGGATGEAPPVAADGTPVKAPDTDLVVQPDEVPVPVTPPPLQVGDALATGAKVEFQGQRGRLARGEGGQLLLNTPKGQVIVANNIADDAPLSDAGIAPTQPNRTVALARANMRAVDAHPEGEKLHDAYDASVQAVEPTWLRATSEHPVLNELADLLDLGHSELAATGEKIEKNKVYERQLAQYPEARLKNAENIVVNTLDRIEGTDAPDWMKSAWSSPLEELWHGIQHIRNIKAKYGNAEKPGPPETVQDLQTPRGNDANRGGSPPDTNPDPAAVAQAKDQQVAGAVARVADVAAKVEAVAPATAEALRQKAEAKLHGHMTSQTSAPPPVVVTPVPPVSQASPSTADTPTTPIQPPPVVASVPVPSDQPAASVLSPPAPASPSSEIPAPATPSGVAPVASPASPVAPPVATSPSAPPEPSAIQPAPSAPPQGSEVVPSPNASTPTGDVQPIRATRAQFIAAYSRAHPNENPDAAWEAEVAAGGVIPVDEQGRDIKIVKPPAAEAAPSAPQPAAPMRDLISRPLDKRLAFSKLTDQDLGLNEADSAGLTQEATRRADLLIEQNPDLEPFSVPIQEEIEIRARRFIKAKSGADQPAESAPVENESPIGALRGVNVQGKRFSWQAVSDTAASDIRRSPQYRLQQRTTSADAPIGEEGSPSKSDVTPDDRTMTPAQQAQHDEEANAYKAAYDQFRAVVMHNDAWKAAFNKLVSKFKQRNFDPITLTGSDRRLYERFREYVRTFNNENSDRGPANRAGGETVPAQSEQGGTAPAAAGDGGGGKAPPPSDPGQAGPGVAGEPQAGGEPIPGHPPVAPEPPGGAQGAGPAPGGKQALAEGDRIRQGRGKFLTVVEVGKRKVRVADDKGNSYVIPRAEAERARVDPNAKPRTFHGVPYAPSGQPDIIDHILDKDGGMLGSTKAADQARKRGEPSRIKDLYNGREGIEGIYSQLFKGTQTPDQMATHLRDEHNLGDGGVQTMYDLIRQAIKSRQSAADEAERQKGLLKEQKVQEKQVNRFAADAGQPEKGDKTVNVNDLHIGQTVTVNGERLKVVAIDPDGTVELEDGLKYGKQELPEGATIYVEKVGRVPKPKAGAPVDDWDTGPEPQSEAPPEASAAPQNQTGLLAETAAPEHPQQPDETGARMNMDLHAAIAPHEDYPFPLRDKPVFTSIKVSNEGSRTGSARTRDGRIVSAKAAWTVRVMGVDAEGPYVLHEYHFGHGARGKAEAERAGKLLQKELDAAKPAAPAKPSPFIEGSKGVATRINNAEESFIRFAMGKGDLTREQAETALAEYRKAKAIKIDAVGGQFTFTHGDFADADVLRRAAGIEEKAPTPEQLDSTIRDAYNKLVERDRFSDVKIADLIDESGLPAETVKEWIKAKSREGFAVPSLGDWSLSDARTRAAGIKFDSHYDPYTQVRLYDRNLREPEQPTGPLPKLRSGEKQGDLLSSQTEDLTLVGERGIDYAAREAERKKAEREAAEAKEKQDREQTSMFEDKPDAAPASNLKPEHAEALDSAIKSSRASFDKLGVPLRENDDNGNRTLAATYDARGNVTFGVDRNALARTIESSDFLRDNADAVRDFIAKSVHEELLHATDLTQTRERWEAQGRKGSFQDFFDGEKRALLESIQQDIGSLSAKNRKLAEGALLDGWNLYHDPNQGETVKSAAEAAARVKQGGTGFSFGNVDHLMEFLGDHPEHAANYMAETLRQFVQLRANNAGLTTETGYLNIVAKLRKFVDGLLKRLRAVAADPKAFSPALSDAIARLEAAQEGLVEDGRMPVVEKGKGFKELNASNATVKGPGIFRFLFAANPITAFHGTRHEVDKFALDKIGTGEGAQVYGWGLYFAENKDVAQSYTSAGASVLMTSPARKAEVLIKTHGEKVAAQLAQEQLESAQKELDSSRLDPTFSAGSSRATREYLQKKWDDVKFAQDVRRLVNSSPAKRGFEEGGQLYTVRLDVDKEGLLDWDKPVSEQSEAVREALENAGLTPEMSGAEVYQELAKRKADILDADSKVPEWMRGESVPNPKAASESLREMGIPGIQFLDQGSRSPYKLEQRGSKWAVVHEPSGQTMKVLDSRAEAQADAERRFGKSDATRNFVMFDDGKISIVEKNGKPVSMDQATGSRSLQAPPVRTRAIPPGATRADIERQAFDEIDNRAVNPGIMAKLAGGARRDLGAIFGGAAAAARDVRNALAPASAGGDARGTADLVRANTGSLYRGKYQGQKQLERAIKAFNSLKLHTAAGQKASIDIMDRIERGVPQADPAMQPFANMMRGLLEGRKNAIQALGIGRLEDAIKDYFPHIWKTPEEAASMYASILGKRPLEGPKGFLKERSIDFLMDGVAQGLEPVSWNPAELTLLKLHEMDRFLMAHNIATEMRDLGLAQPLATKAQQAMWLTIQSKRAKGNPLSAEEQHLFNVFGASHPLTGPLTVAPEAGNVEVRLAGQTYQVQADAGRIINNYLSPGLRGKALFDALRGAGNLLNQAQLGLSFFHAGFVVMDTTTSKAALGIEQIVGGIQKGDLSKAVRGVSNLGQAAVPGLAAVKTYRQGRELLRAYEDPARVSREMREIAAALQEGGGRVTMDDFYATNAMKTFKAALREGNVAGAVFRAPMAFLEFFSHPLMQNVVPRMKLGVFADLAREEIERLGSGASPEQRRAAFRKAWDTVDNRLGQVIYDNLFMHKVLKDSLMLGVRSLGWNLGTIRELGGGIKDANPLSIIQRARAGDPLVTHQLAYTLALPFLAGVIGSLLQYMHTGQGPQDLKDALFPRTGKKLPDGSDERLTLPTYIKDVDAYWKHPLQTPVHKTNPLIALLSEMYQNKDYYGGEIRNSNDPLMLQLGQELNHVFKAPLPFSWSGIMKRQELNAASVIESAVGVTPAPADLSRTPAVNALIEAVRRKLPTAGRTPEETERADLRKTLLSGARTGQNIRPQVQQAVRAGTITAQGAQRILADAHVDPRLKMLRSLSVEDAQRVYDLANPEERRLFIGPLRAKQARAGRPMAALAGAR